MFLLDTSIVSATAPAKRDVGPVAFGAILDRARGHDPGFEDIAIAATAAVRSFTVLTASERHFAPLGIPIVNPLKRLPVNH